MFRKTCGAIIHLGEGARLDFAELVKDEAAKRRMFGEGTVDDRLVRVLDGKPWAEQCLVVREVLKKVRPGGKAWFGCLPMGRELNRRGQIVTYASGQMAAEDWQRSDGATRNCFAAFDGEVGGLCCPETFNTSDLTNTRCPQTCCCSIFNTARALLERSSRSRAKSALKNTECPTGGKTA